jgi:photosystem II stability/assembly factor-like uncharacterized protein
MKKKYFIILIALFMVSNLISSSKTIDKDKLLMKKINQTPTSSKVRLNNYKKHLQMKENSIFKNLKWKMIGPFEVSGRVTDIEVPNDKPYVYYVASASGGVWKTDNNGITWTSVFDSAPSISIGDIAIAPSDSNIIYIGAGENNSSRSSYSGTGIYRSDDGGKTWERLGLSDTHHIGRIIIDPKNPNIVYVAAIGHLYTYNSERGVYKTTDGGKTWEKILFLNKKTGAIDLVMNPKNSNILYAAMWEKERRAWNFVESGDSSGIYKTTDGGAHWVKLTKGLPSGKVVGRIGLSIYENNPDIIYAVVDNQEKVPVKKSKKDSDRMTALKVRHMSKQEFISLGKEKITKFLKSYHIPKEYTACKIIKLLKSNKITTKDIADYVMDADKALYETSIKGTEVYVSKDGGNSWTKTNKGKIRGMAITYGYYFGQIRVNPKNWKEIYIMGVPIMKSVDGGKTWKNTGGRGVHGDFHALWIDPLFPKHIIVGNDGGVNISYDGGKNWIKVKTLPISQFYTINYDFKKPYNVYGGLQDNGVVMGSSANSQQNYKKWQMIYGGDGGFVEIDHNDENTVYAEFQFGNISRLNLKNKSSKFIKPHSKIGEQKLRFNWITPFVISHYNSQILYLGANKLFKSYNRGDKWYPISSDLTKNQKPQGDVPFSTITTISESPINPGLLLVGTDDGLVWITHNDGAKWKKIIKGLPREKWVSRVVASKYSLSRVYVALNGYRDDDFTSYLFMSDNYGGSYKSVKGNLPDEPINVVIEDPYMENILYVGTDAGVYVSLDMGKNWYSLNTNLPDVAVHDLKIHPRERDLIIGTHGRSAYILNVNPIEKLTNNVLKKPFYLFDIKDIPVNYFEDYDYYYLANQPVIYYYLSANSKIELEISNSKNKSLLKKEIKANKGVNIYNLNLNSILGKRVIPQVLNIKFTVNGKTYQKTLKIVKSKLPFNPFEKAEIKEEI